MDLNLPGQFISLSWVDGCDELSVARQQQGGRAREHGLPLVERVRPKIVHQKGSTVNRVTTFGTSGMRQIRELVIVTSSVANPASGCRALRSWAQDSQGATVGGCTWTRQGRRRNFPVSTM
jgi:hypothetical protein